MVEWREEGEFLFGEQLSGRADDANLERQFAMDCIAGQAKDELYETIVAMVERSRRERR